jgi:hypothetical protein
MPSVVIAERTIHYHAVVGCRAERRHGAAGPPDAIAATSRGRGARRSRTDTPGPATFPLELETSEKGTGLGQRIAEIHEVKFAVVNPDPKFPIQRECRSAGPGAGLRPRRPGAPPIPQWGPYAPSRRGRNPTPPAAPPTPTRAGNFGSRLAYLEHHVFHPIRGASSGRLARRHGASRLCPKLCPRASGFHLSVGNANQHGKENPSASL